MKIATMSKLMIESCFEKAFNDAHAAGMEAGNCCRPAPMVVTEVGIDDRPCGQQWVIDDGVCGFAWVVVRPGNSSFAKWLKKTDRGDKHYYGGISIWVRGFGQSMTRKEAYAYAFAKVLRDHGYNAPSLLTPTFFPSRLSPSFCGLRHGYQFHFCCFPSLPLLPIIIRIL